jgi:RimJ/RimL family protein N-acetyltransferase
MAEVHIRKATLTDAAAIAEIHVVSWQHTYRGLVPDAYLDTMSIINYQARWQASLVSGIPQLIVAELAGQIVGFSSFGQCRDVDASSNDGEVWSIYLSPLYWGRGFGTALLIESRKQLLAQGFMRINLWVIIGNERAVHFYRAAGFRPENESLTTFALLGCDIEEIRYVWSS